uniref:Uncharacterized protein n=1 Tax=Physcomitrium patens TaxID=3218 RepID=A0A2K1IDG6_PHYPA|nr:hypothetical protein PHYPA_029473 [Physcomitrium patens]
MLEISAVVDFATFAPLDDSDFWSWKVLLFLRSLPKRRHLYSEAKEWGFSSGKITGVEGSAETTSHCKSKAKNKIRKDLNHKNDQTLLHSNILSSSLEVVRRLCSILRSGVLLALAIPEKANMCKPSVDPERGSSANAVLHPGCGL